MKTLSKAVAVASLLTAGVMSAQVANAEVSYSADLATTYLWRGTDLGGTMFSGAADYSHDSGLYAGAWVAGGDLSQGNETDLYVGFAKEFGAVSIDASVITYVYNNGNDDGDDVNGSPGEFSEFIGSVGVAGASVGYTTSLQDQDYKYITLGYSIAGADITLGLSDNGKSGDAEAAYSHLDISYGLTDALSVTVSQAIDDSSDAVVAAGDAVDEDVIVVMSYSLPL